MVVKLRHTKHMSTESEQNVNHLLSHLAVRTATSRTEMVQLEATRTLGLKITVFGITRATRKTIRQLQSKMLLTSAELGNQTQYEALQTLDFMLNLCRTSFN